MGRADAVGRDHQLTPDVTRHLRKMKAAQQVDPAVDGREIHIEGSRQTFLAYALGLRREPPV